ncbi:hypothetical protein NKH77_54885 [Streptomyces sp. M19]
MSQYEDFQEDFRTRLTRSAARCERAGWSGVLVPHNLHEVDPGWWRAAWGRSRTGWCR